MVHGEKYINAEEIVKHKDGRIDLFNTILARKDKNSQIPVLAETKTASVSQPLPLLPSAPMPGKYRKLLPASAPSTIINKVDSSPVSDLKEAEGDTGTIASFSRKRLSSPPSPTTTPSSIGINTTVNSKISSSNDIGSSKDGSYARLRKVYKVTTTPIGEGHSHGYLDIFKGYVEQPSTVPAEIAYWHDHEHLIIKDAYPKSKVHMLVLPRQRIDKLDKLSSTSGITLIQRLKERAHWLVTRLKEESPELELKIGFHVIPSLMQLHLHVISQDFCGTGLTKKRHWNTFTTPFFITPDEVITILQQRGSFILSPQDVINYEAMSKRDLKCNQCKETLKNMPMLKKHLEEHYLKKKERVGAMK